MAPDTKENNPYSEIPVAILCGGRGTRLKEETEAIPKPLVKVGDQPILWHIMKMYYTQGFRKFVLLTGYKGENIKEYFSKYPLYHSDFTVKFREGRAAITYHTLPKEDWEVTIVDTGLDTQTGGRLKRAERFLNKGTFMLTYGDGVADVELSKLFAFHREHGGLATMTGVYPPGRFGVIQVEGARVVNFQEKPSVREGYINGGFFVLEPGVFPYFSESPSLNLEKEVLPRLAAESHLSVFPHHGYWQCMDTLRDVEFLNDEWARGNAPWKNWTD